MIRDDYTTPYQKPHGACQQDQSMLYIALSPVQSENDLYPATVGYIHVLSMCHAEFDHSENSHPDSHHINQLASSSYCKQTYPMWHA